MKTLYLDIFSGISGDMFTGAMIALGVPVAHIEAELKKVHLSGYHVHARQETKAQIAGIKFDVHCHEQEAHSHPLGTHIHAGHSHPHQHGPTPIFKAFAPLTNFPTHDHHRTFSDIRSLIDQSGLSAWVKQKSIAVFRRIAVAEGRIHGLPEESVHVHEVGAIDSIVDIVAACVCIQALDHPRILAAPVCEGTGWIHCAHGRFPIPAPATLAILGDAGIAISQCEEENELVTPTGAALLAEFVTSFGPLQNILAEKIGYGLGTRDNKTRPNVLRAILGESQDVNHASWETDSVAVLETNLDDTNPELLGFFVELALAEGALDVFHTSIHMKKNRPGVLLTVLCEPDKADKFSEIILRQTSAFGVRQTTAHRRKLRREWMRISTCYGDVDVKIGKLGAEVLHQTPEFESCKAAAVRTGVPLSKVYEAVNQSLNTDEESRSQKPNA